MKNLRTFGLSLFLSVFVWCVSVAQDAQEVYNKVIGSTVTVITDKGQGSGFVFFENNLVVTNWHVLKGGSSAEIIPNNSSTSYKVVGVVAADVDADIAIVRVQGFWKTPLRSNTITNIGQVVYAIGSPRGVRATISNGILSGETMQHIQTTAATSPGSSGGPLVDKYGFVVGVNVAKVREAENLNLAVPISKVVALQSEIRSNPIALTEFNKMVDGSTDEDETAQESHLQTSNKLYELNWTYAGTAYQGILVIDDENHTSDKVIVRFYSSKNHKYYHVVQELSREKFKENLVLKGSNPIDLLTKEKTNYTPDNFLIYNKNNETNIFIFDGTKDHKGELIIEQVKYKRMGEDELNSLINQWYNQN